MAWCNERMRQLVLVLPRHGVPESRSRHQEVGGAGWWRAQQGHGGGSGEALGIKGPGAVQVKC